MHNEIIITDHATSQAKRRANIKGNNLIKMAHKALLLGLGYKDSKGCLCEYIKNKYRNYYKANNIKVYGHNIFIFKNNILLTILDLPQYLWYFWDTYKDTIKKV